MAHSVLSSIVCDIDPGLSQELYGAQTFNAVVSMLTSAKKCGLTPDAIGLNRRDLEAVSAYYWSYMYKSPWDQHTLVVEIAGIPVEQVDTESSPLVIYREAE